MDDHANLGTNNKPLPSHTFSSSASRRVLTCRTPMPELVNRHGVHQTGNREGASGALIMVPISFLTPLYRNVSKNPFGYKEQLDAHLPPASLYPCFSVSGLVSRYSLFYNATTCQTSPSDLKHLVNPPEGIRRSVRCINS